jgi:thiol-disulfide isomerase/thioredoxin
MTIAALGGTAVLVSGCASDTEQPATPATASMTSAAASPAPDAAVPAQLQFSATTLGGEQFSGESLLGSPAVLWFWAPWCPTCQREAPMVGQAAADHPGVRFLGVAGLDQPPAMQQFVDRYPVGDFTHLADVDGEVWTKFGITQQPAFAFVGADGTVDVVRGTLSDTELTERIDALSRG